MFEKLKALFKKRPRKTLLEVQAEKNFKTDKGTLHSYLEVYSEIFAGYRNPSILEIGVDKGESLKLWKTMFPKAIVHGVDINPKSQINIPGCEIFIADINSWVPQRKYDIIIDDGSHTYRDQMSTFIKLFESYCGGHFIVEDVQDMVSAKKLAALNPKKATLHDLREKKNRYDDIMVVFKK